MQIDQDINLFAKKIAGTNFKRPDHFQFGRNQQLFDLGLEAVGMRSREEVNAKIRDVDREFDFVFITEEFDQSLVLLKEHMCWSMDDVRYGISRRNIVKTVNLE